MDGLYGSFGNVLLNIRFDTDVDSAVSSSVKVPIMPNWLPLKITLLAAQWLPL